MNNTQILQAQPNILNQSLFKPNVVNQSLFSAKQSED